MHPLLAQDRLTENLGYRAAFAERQQQRRAVHGQSFADRAVKAADQRNLLAHQPLQHAQEPALAARVLRQAMAVGIEVESAGNGAAHDAYVKILAAVDDIVELQRLERGPQILGTNIGAGRHAAATALFLPIVEQLLEFRILDLLDRHEDGRVRHGGLHRIEDLNLGLHCAHLTPAALTLRQRYADLLMNS